MGTFSAGRLLIYFNNFSKDGAKGSCQYIYNVFVIFVWCY